MGKILSDLSYNGKGLRPLTSPLEELKGLYQKKENDYLKVVNTEQKLRKFLSDIDFQEVDKAIVQDARNLVNDTFSKFREEGDLENRVLETQRLATDLANNGLSELQKVSKQRSNYRAGLKERFDNNNITRTQYLRAIKDADTRYTASGGIQKDEESGVYTGSYNGRPVADYINVSKEVADVLKGFKANTLPLNFNGKRIVRTPEGFFLQGTQEEVREADLTKAAKQYIASNQAIQDQFADDIYYEKANLGEIKEDDVKRAIRSGISNEVAQALGVGDGNIENLKYKLEAKGLDLEDAYDAIRRDQLTNESLALGVDKESYKKYTEKYIKPIKDGKDSGSKKKTPATMFGEILTTTDLKQSIGKDELAASAKLLEETKSNLTNLETQFNALADSPNAQEKARLTNEINNAKFVLSQLEEQTRETYEKIVNAPTEDSYEKGYFSYQRALKDQELKKEFATPNGKNLILKALTTELTTDDIFPATPEGREQYENSIHNYTYANDADRKAGRKTFKETYDEFRQRIAESKVKKYNELANFLKDKVEEEDKPLTLDYITRYHTLAFSKMTPKQRQNHPMAQLWDTASALSVANEHQFMSSATSNLDIKTHLVENLDIDEDDIKWEDSKLVPLFDYRADLRNGSYRPAMEMVVKIQDGKKTKDVRVPVFYDNANYNTRYGEQLVKYRKALLDQHKETPLSRSQLEILDRTNINIYNSTKYGANLDRQNLYQAPNGSDTEIEVWDGINLNIRTYTENFADGNNFYITQKIGNTVEFLGVDNNNQPVRLSEAEMRDPATIQKINNGQIQLSSANTVNGLKAIISDMVLNYSDSSTNTGNTAPQGFVNVKNDPIIRLNPSGDFEQTVINEKVYPKVQNLFRTYPNIIATDISRNNDTAVGGSVQNSAHKVNNGAKAIDVRMNDSSAASKEAMMIHNLSVAEKRQLGILKTIAHGEGSNYHLHIEFI